MSEPLHDAATVEPLELTRAVAAFNLPDSACIDQPGGAAEGATHRLLDAPVDDQRFRTLLSQCQRHRVTGLLQHAIEQGALPVTDEQRTRVAGRHLEWCTSMLGLDRELLRVVGVLEDADIEVVVLKGTSSAHLHYPDPGMRLFGDNDVLLRGEQIDPALSVLIAAGYSRPKASAGPGFDRRFGKGATLIGPEGRELDVHRNLVFGSFGLATDLDELWASTSGFDLGGRRLRALGPEQRLLHACFHAALGDPYPGLNVVRDLAQQWYLPHADHEQAARLAERWRSMPVVKRAVWVLRRELDLEVAGPLAAAAAAYRPSPAEARAVASYVGARRSFTAMVLASLPYLPSTRARAAFLRTVAMPSREFIRSRGGGSLSDWWQRGRRAVFNGGR